MMRKVKDLRLYKLKGYAHAIENEREKGASLKKFYKKEEILERRD